VDSLMFAWRSHAPFAGLATIACRVMTTLTLFQLVLASDTGVRDCAVRDPAGNLMRIQELR
jgi:hypothetical protein